MIRVGYLVAKTRAEGPGTRFAIWVQGCDRNCPGCYAVHLQPHTGGRQFAVSDLIAQIEAVRTEISGVTFLGGEPFLQANALARVAAAAHAKGLSVLCFTGYTLEELVQSADPHKSALLSQVDLLIDGPYREDLRSFARPLVGSDNQRFHYLTQRIAPEEIARFHNSIECRIGKDGVLRLNGMGDFPVLTDHLLSRTSSKEALRYG